jgi:SAM-dependent methyltransferase
LDPDAGETCAWYHGFLPYLRLLGMVATPAHHGDFFTSALAFATGQGRQPRVLISGAADHYMLAQAHAGCLAHHLEPRMTVVDICETPLALNRWYAAHAGLAIQTRQADILGLDNPGAFDVICTHSLLGRFSPAQRPDLMASWHRLLATGGRVITVNRVRAQVAGKRIGFNQSHSLGLRDAVLSRAEQFAGKLDVEHEILGQMAEAYSARHKVHPVRSCEEVRDMFESAGFEMEQLDLLQTGKSDEKPVSGPTMLDGSHYACIVARKP